MGRSPCCEKVGLKRGPWTSEEDKKLLDYIEEHGHGSWRALPTKAGLQRCGKSCRLRWTNYLRSDIKRGKFSLQEEQTIIQLHALLGNRWSAIATNLPKRTDNEIKNYWNTHLKKRLIKMGIDPVTHKPKTDTLGPGSGNPANLSHMAQWECARLEAEGRLVREYSKQLVSINPHDHQLGGFNNTSQASVINRAATAPPPRLDVVEAWQGTWMKTRSENNNTLSRLVAIDDLESPTSILSFPCCESTLVGALEFAKSNNNPMIICESGMIKEGCDIMEFDDHDQDMTNYGCTDNTVSSAWFCHDNFKAGNNVDDNVTTLPTAAFSNVTMELGFTDHVLLAVYNSEEDQNNPSNIVMEESSHDHQHEHGSYGSGDVFEENNKIYWNCILNN